MRSVLLRFLLVGASGSTSCCLAAAPATESHWLLGDWRVVHGRAAPWLAAESPRPDTRAWIGSRVSYRADRVEGAAAFACDDARYEFDARRIEGLFQGNLRDPSADAAQLGVTADTVPSISLSCDRGLFDLHRAAPDAVLVALDNVIWTLDRSPGALASGGTPEAAVQRLLEAHFAGDMGFVPDAIGNKRGWLDDDLAEHIDRYFAQPFPPDEVPPINADPFTDTQEYPALFSVGQAHIDAADGTAEVPVRFDDGHRARSVRYLMRQRGERWLLDDIRYEHDAGFRAMLMQTP